MLLRRSFLTAMVMAAISTITGAASADHALLLKRAEPSEADSTTTNKKSAPSAEPHITTTTKQQAPSGAKSAVSSSKAAASTNRVSSAGGNKSAGSSNINGYSQHGISTFSATASRAAGANNPTSTPSSQAISKSASPLSVGAIVGIAVGGAVLVGLIAALLATRRRKKREQLYKTRMMKPDPFTMGFGSHDPPPPLKVSAPHVAFSIPSPSPSPSSTPMVQILPPVTLSSPSSPSLARPPTSPPTTVATTTTMTTTTATTLAPRPDGNRSIGIFTVVSTYTPTLSDELDIQAGDKVEIFIEYDDGWCQGVNLSRGAVKGVFPKHCVDYYQKQHLPDSMKRVSSMYMSQTSHYV